MSMEDLGFSRSRSTSTCTPVLCSHACNGTPVEAQDEEAQYDKLLPRH